MTLQDLCDGAQVSVGYLSQIERDNATPTLGTLAQIAAALNVGVDYFIAAPNRQNSLTRENTRQKFSLDGSSIVYEKLSAEFSGNILSSFVLTVPVGFKSETVMHDGEELLYVLEGEVSVQLGDENITMVTGDSLHFRGNLSHSWANNTDKEAKLLWSGTLAFFRSSAGASLAEGEERFEGMPKQNIHA